MRLADILLFPSIRDNNPAVIFEAFAAGAVPIVVDFGGPGDIVPRDIGCKVPLTNEAEVVARMEGILKDLAHDRDRLERLRQQGISYARECLSWDAKAQTLTAILEWALRRGPKPDLPPPKALHPRRATWLGKALRRQTAGYNSHGWR
jgi:glycosyltransferase involved in cell wall biosynthesis